MNATEKIRAAVQQAIASGGRGAQAAIARQSGLSDGGLRDFLTGRAETISVDNAERLGFAIGASISSILNDPSAIQLPEFAMIPVYDARVSAGAGAINDSSPSPIHYDAFRLDWLHSKTSSVEALCVLRVAGDSMWSTLHDGDRVLVDTAVKHYTRDGLYVVRFSDQDETMVKRIQRDPATKKLRIKSDNPDYPTWDGVAESHISIFGRVIWLGRNIG